MLILSGITIISTMMLCLFIKHMPPFFPGSIPHQYMLPLIAVLAISTPLQASEYEDARYQVQAILSADKPIKAVNDLKWRSVCIRWAYKVADHFEIDRSAVIGAVEIFDHFLLKRKILAPDYPVYWTASFILAIKFYDPDVTVSLFSKLSTDQCSVKDLRDAERDICEALRYKTFYPTTLSYIEIYIAYVKRTAFYRYTNIPLFDAIADELIFASELEVFDERDNKTRCQKAGEIIQKALWKIELTEVQRIWLTDTRFQLLR